MRVSHWALLALVCCAGCVTEEPKTLPELQAGTEERSYYKPITNHRLEFRQVGNNVFETGKKAVVTFRLKNQGKKTVRIDEWRMKDDDNVLLYCQPWLPGMKEPDPNAWISLNDNIPEQSRRNPLTLQVGNMALLNRELPFVEHMYVSAGKERRFFIKGVLNLKSLTLETPVRAIRVHAPIASKQQNKDK